MPRSRALSQVISEGEGISLIAAVDGPEAARTAEAAGAEAVFVEGGPGSPIAEVRAATALPILSTLDGDPRAEAGAADAYVVNVQDDDRERLQELFTALGDRFELAPRIADEELLAFVLEDFDPEILVLGADDRDEDALERILDLLPDVPAGKLAIAEVPVTSRADVDQLERAGVDAVIVGAGSVAELAGAAPPQV